MKNAPSYLLVLNTAEGYIQIGLAQFQAQDNKLHYEAIVSQEWLVYSQGAELLAPLLQSTLERLGAKPQAIQRIACVSGPGSFTGIRLALATAAGLSRATGALQAKIPYLLLLALSTSRRLVLPLLKTRPLWVLTHARKNLVHAQSFTLSDTLPEPVTNIVVGSIEEIASSIITSSQNPILVGSGVVRNKELLESFLQNHNVLFLPDEFATPDASALFLAASKAIFCKTDIEPEYIRPCDAEENLEKIAISLGINPIDACETFRTLTRS